MIVCKTAVTERAIILVLILDNGCGPSAALISAKGFLKIYGGNGREWWCLIYLPEIARVAKSDPNYYLNPA
jgi:hypothetical protein